MNNLNGLYIVTEWDFDKELVEMVLPSEYRDRVKVMSAGGYSSALSLARSILSARHQANTILVVDADFNDPKDVEEREDFIRAYMHRSTTDDRFAILMQRPEIEAVFFEDKGALENLTGRTFTDLEFQLAKDNPKQNLLNFLSLPQEDKGQLLDKARANEDIEAELKTSSLSTKLSEAIRRFLN